MTTVGDVITTGITVTKTAALIGHVKQNNIAYLLGIAIAHMIGITEKVWNYGSGMC